MRIPSGFGFRVVGNPYLTETVVSEDDPRVPWRFGACQRYLYGRGGKKLRNRKGLAARWRRRSRRVTQEPFCLIDETTGIIYCHPSLLKKLAESLGGCA